MEVSGPLPVFLCRNREGIQGKKPVDHAQHFNGEDIAKILEAAGGK